MALRALSNAVPCTLAGLAAKARAVRHLRDGYEYQYLAPSLATDIGVLAGEGQVQS
jgi:hypothetical protein